MSLRSCLAAIVPALLVFSAGAVQSASPLPAGWSSILMDAAQLTEPGERVLRVSEPFLGVPYQAGTLIGGPGIPEELVANLEAVDCFTFLDYVESLRRSNTPGEFRSRLVEVRYRDGIIAWDHRRHFFTDWAAASGGRVVDVTLEIGGNRTEQATKTLNRKADGTLYLAGVAAQERIVRFLPIAALNDTILGRLRTGDYLGIYTPEAGLDVSHVGIVIRHAGQLLLRHASSRRDTGRVIDSDLRSYLAGKPGVVVLRPVVP
jgi:hypothetical protein